MILVDTSVWVAADRDGQSIEAGNLRKLISGDEVATTGMVLAEVLQGARSESHRQRLASDMSALHYLEAGRSTWLLASRLGFELLRRGQQTPLTDLVIAAVALENDVEIYATDSHFQRVPDLRLHAPGEPDR